MTIPYRISYSRNNKSFIEESLVFKFFREKHCILFFIVISILNITSPNLISKNHTSYLSGLLLFPPHSTFYSKTNPIHQGILMQITKKDLTIIFNEDNAIYLRMIHLFLNQIYYNKLFGENEENAFELSDISKLKLIESTWLENEKNLCLNAYDCEKKIDSVTIVENALKQHPVFQHELFDYLCHDADIHDLKEFLLSESILNLEFFDYLALSIIGVSDYAKSEIAANLWDEAGRGNQQYFHTTLFKNLMTELGLKYNRSTIIETMSWQGLAGINLFSCLSIYPYNKTKYLGLMSATEMLDPPHYNKLIKGISRILGKQKIDQRYYIEHEHIDIEHASGWLNKIVLPEITEKPNKSRDFWLGFYMRLNSAQRYYDNLLKTFSKKKAA